MNNLLVMRKRHNKKAVDLAAELGVSRKHYYDLEKGNRTLNENHIKTFMRFYNCSADEILYYKYTKADFANNPEELAREIEDIIYYLLEKKLSDPDDPLEFPSYVIGLIEDQSRDIRSAHDLDFKFTPSDILQLIREINDFDFKFELFEMLKRVKEQYPSSVKYNDLNLFGHLVDHRMDEYIDERFSGMLGTHLNSSKETDVTYEKSLTIKEERDIAQDLEKMLSDLESDNPMAFQGEPMDDDDKEFLRISLENSMRLAKQMAKKKFNPNKNKK